MDAAKPSEKPQFKRGDIILRSRPWSYVVDDDFVENVCHACFYKNTKNVLGVPTETKRLIECKKCKFCRYCSPKCERADRKHHELECQYLKSFRLMHEKNLFCDGHLFPPTIVRHLARIILRLQRGEVADNAGDCVPPPEGGAWKFTDLMSHAAEIKGSFQLIGFLQAEPILQVYLKGNKYFESLTSEKLLEIYGRLLINRFGAYKFSWEAYSQFGSVLCLGASKFDHDCEANARWVLRDGGEMHIIAIKNIDRFDQVRLAYVEEMESTDVRQKFFQTNYYFTCTCRMCSSKSTTSPHNDDYFRSIRCAHNFDKNGKPKARRAATRACKHPCPVDKDYKPVVERCEAGHAQKFPEEVLKHARQLAEQMDIKNKIDNSSNTERRRAAIQSILLEFQDYIHQYNKHFLDTATFAAGVLRDRKDLVREAMLEALEGLQKFKPDSVEYTWTCYFVSLILLKHGFVQEAEKIFNDNLPLLKLLFGENEETVKETKERFAALKIIVTMNEIAKRTRKLWIAAK